ncbi:hypothetical protein [Flavobacterium rivuli]|nr:hypothetical protein [Flavobacterium rivuli]
MDKRLVYIIAGIAAIGILPVIFFVVNFYSLSVSKDITQWGALGDYFGGILNALFSFLSLIATIYIAYILTNIEEKRNQQNLKFEKDRLLREFRESEYKRINFELQKVWLSLIEPNPEIANNIIHNCIWQYRYFRTSNMHLFPFLKDEEVKNLGKSLENISELLDTRDLSNKDEILRMFIQKLDLFNQKIQTFLLES